MTIGELPAVRSLTKTIGHLATEGLPIRAIERTLEYLENDLDLFEVRWILTLVSENLVYISKETYDEDVILLQEEIDRAYNSRSKEDIRRILSAGVAAFKEARRVT